ncbi:MAG: DUF3108 domain-containing protein [Prevotellaceae bacterium]|jgi:hypothetical protein|nr:DUF3108 domain-containing protein [Prevotellaceae bacterium]
MKALTATALAILLLLSSAGAAQQACTLRVEEENLAFGNGESLKYAASYLWGLIFTDVGEVDMNVDKIKEYPSEWQVTINARTHKFYDKFFKVRDYYEAVFSAPEIRSLYFRRDIREGNYAMKNTYRFDNENNTIDATIQKNEDSAKRMELVHEGCTFDVLTYFYYLRNLDYDNVYPGKIFKLSIALDEEIYSIRCRFIERERKKTKSLPKKVNCLKFAVEVIAGSVFTGNENITMWVSDDRNHIPLELESPVLVGRVKARITGFENLKYPLNYVK